MEEITVHGSIFFLLKKFVNHNFPGDTWETLNKEAGTSGIYDITMNYPISEIGSIIITASRFTGLSENELKERFGEYLVPDLFKLYADYLKPEWTTFDVLIHTEHIMHGAVRKLNSTANPPVLNVTRVSNKLFIDYHSKRKMGSLAVGIIRGIAKYYNEENLLDIIPITNPDDERVQIRVEFKE